MNALPAVEHTPFSRYLTEAPQKTYCELTAKKIFYRFLEVISYIALIAIMIAVFTISYTIPAAMAAHPPLLVVGLVLSTPFLTWGITKFSVRANMYATLSETEKSVIHQMKGIKDWKAQQIQTYLRKEVFDLKNINLRILGDLQPNEPLCALQPLIARYHQIKDITQKGLQESLQIRIETEEKLIKAQRKGIAVDESLKAMIRYEGHRAEFKKIREEVIPSLFNAAVLLQIMRDPTNLDLEIQQPNFDMNIPNVGKFNPQSFENWMDQELFRAEIVEIRNRLAAKEAERGDQAPQPFDIAEPAREFFSFPNRPGLTYQDIFPYLNPLFPEGIRQKLFPERDGRLDSLSD